MATEITFPTIPEDEFVLYATLHAKPSHGDALEKILRILKGLTTREPGVLDYVISRDDEERDTFHVFERYTGRKAFEEHIASQEFQVLTHSGTLREPPRPKMLKPLEPM